MQSSLSQGCGCWFSRSCRRTARVRSLPPSGGAFRKITRGEITTEAGTRSLVNVNRDVLSARPALCLSPAPSHRPFFTFALVPCSLCCWWRSSARSTRRGLTAAALRLLCSNSDSLLSSAWTACKAPLVLQSADSLFSANRPSALTQHWLQGAVQAASSLLFDKEKTISKQIVLSCCQDRSC